MTSDKMQGFEGSLKPSAFHRKMVTFGNGIQHALGHARASNFTEIKYKTFAPANITLTKRPLLEILKMKRNLTALPV
ncbi:MAG: hypothetical protein WCA08_26075 [Desulfoferrobacter sp.]